MPENATSKATQGPQQPPAHPHCISGKRPHKALKRPVAIVQNIELI